MIERIERLWGSDEDDETEGRNFLVNLEQCSPELDTTLSGLHRKINSPGRRWLEILLPSAPLQKRDFGGWTANHDGRNAGPPRYAGTQCIRPVQTLPSQALNWEAHQTRKRKLLFAPRSIRYLWTPPDIAAYKGDITSLD